MAWTAPMTAVATAAFTAAQFNAHVRDNLNETAPAKATAAGRIFVSTGANAIAERAITGSEVSTAQTTASTSYADLSTIGPAVTVTTGAQALVIVSATQSNSTAGANTFTGFAVSGASTVAAADDSALWFNSDSSGQAMRAACVELVTGLTPGSNTFTAKYKVSAGTGTWSRRSIAVIAL